MAFFLNELKQYERSNYVFSWNNFYKFHIGMLSLISFLLILSFCCSVLNCYQFVKFIASHVNINLNYKQNIGLNAYLLSFASTCFETELTWIFCFYDDTKCNKFGIYDKFCVTMVNFCCSFCSPGWYFSFFGLDLCATHAFFQLRMRLTEKLEQFVQKNRPGNTTACAVA